MDPIKELQYIRAANLLVEKVLYAVPHASIREIQAHGMIRRKYLRLAADQNKNIKSFKIKKRKVYATKTGPNLIQLARSAPLIGKGTDPSLNPKKKKKSK